MTRALLTATVADQAGNTVQNALVNVYLVGTTTPVSDMFAADSGGSPITTLTSDSRGQIVGYFTASKTVDLLVTDNSHTAYLSATPSLTLTFSSYTKTLAVEPYSDVFVHATGDETVAGIKTFSSAPLVPDLAYDATTWNGSIATPTRNAIRDKFEAHDLPYVPTVATAEQTSISDGSFTSMGASAGQFFRLAVYQDAAAPTVGVANNGGYGAAFYAVQRFSGTIPNTPNNYFFGDAALHMLQLVGLDMRSVVTFAGINCVENDTRVVGVSHLTNVYSDYNVMILAGEDPPSGTITTWAAVKADTMQGSAAVAGLTITNAYGGLFLKPMRGNGNVTVTNNYSLYAQEGQVFECKSSSGAQGAFELRDRDTGEGMYQRVVNQVWQLLKPDFSLVMTQVDSNGIVSAYGGVRPSGSAAHTAGSVLRSGSGAPDNAVGSNGDYYFRSGTPDTALQRIYARTGGVWVGIL